MIDKLDSVIYINIVFVISGVMLVWGRGGGGPPSSAKPGAMSLFHDFKLKRRKVDSRGSSDGEYLQDIFNLQRNIF